jgi:hypothetical protein
MKYTKGVFGSQPYFAKPKFDMCGSHKVWLKNWTPQSVAKVGKKITL